MSEAEIGARLIAALGDAAAREAGVGAPLVSVSVEYIAPGAVARVDTRVERKTRTLAFLTADAFAADGARVASATSVHKLS